MKNPDLSVKFYRDNGEISARKLVQNCCAFIWWSISEMLDRDNGEISARKLV